MADPVIYYVPRPFTKRLDEQFHFDSKTAVHNNLNAMLKAIEMRLVDLDKLRITQAEVIDSLVEVGLQRMDDVFTPLINAAVERLNTLGVQFNAPSTTSNNISLGPKIFNIPSPQRDAFIYGSHVNVRYDPSNFMVCTVDSYNRTTGDLALTAMMAEGSGTYANWTIYLTAPPDVTHATRTDNPHHVTSEQVDAYNKATSNFMYTSLINSLLSMSGNLVELTNRATARANLGLGSAATKDVGVSPAQVPQNLNLGSSAYLTAGYAEGNVPQLRSYGLMDAGMSGIGFSPEGRLTLQAGTPIPSNLNLGERSVLFYAPYNGKHCPVWNGSAWLNFPIVAPTDVNGLIVDMGGSPFFAADKNFDVFITYMGPAATVWLAIGPPWPGDAARGVGPDTSELEMWHGIQVNKYACQIASGAGISQMPARTGTYVGTIRTSSNGMTRCDLQPPPAEFGNFPRSFVWNRYNRIPMQAVWQDGTNNWSVPITPGPIMGLYRRVNASPTNRIGWVVGDDATNYHVNFRVTAGVSKTFYIQVSQDETNPARIGGQVSINAADAGFNLSSIIDVDLHRVSPIGFHFAQMLEAAQGAAVTIYGINAIASLTMEM